MDDEKVQICVDFLDYVSDHRDSIDCLLQDRADIIREWAAEQGLELTPDECIGLLSILRTSLDIVNDGWH